MSTLQNTLPRVPARLVALALVVAFAAAALIASVGQGGGATQPATHPAAQSHHLEAPAASDGGHYAGARP